MRDIRFRGKIQMTDMWEYGDLLIWETNDNKPLINGFEVIPETVGQYTGMKDKNGNDIYEGMTLKHENKFYDPMKVIFKKGAFKIEFGDGSGTMSLFKFESSEFEIIPD